MQWSAANDYNGRILILRGIKGKQFLVVIAIKAELSLIKPLSGLQYPEDARRVLLIGFPLQHALFAIHTGNSKHKR